jgi:hypothetical protein
LARFSPNTLNLLPSPPARIRANTFSIYVPPFIDS